jgi:hypothetical protein
MVITTSQFGFFTGNIIDLNTLFTDVLVTGCEFAVQPNMTGINGPMTFYNIDGNSFFATTQTGTIGVHLTSAASSGNNRGTVSNNLFFDLVDGILIDASVNATVRGNSYSNNTTNLVNNASATINTDLGDVTSATSAQASYVGEHIKSNVPFGSAVSLVTGTAKNLTSVTLAPGHWSCGGDVAFNPAGTTTIAAMVAGTSTVTNTLPPQGTGGMNFLTATFTTGAPGNLPVGQSSQDVTASTPVYLVAQANFGTSTMSVYGNIDCMRNW